MKTKKRIFKSMIWTILIMAMVFQPFSALVLAQTTEPAGITIESGSAICGGGSEDFPVAITLPPGAVIENVDVFLLFDDTGSFAGFVPTVASIFSGLVTTLEGTVPGVEFGFGVGRFEDYGGPGTGFSFENTTGRPFILNQPIITAADAGGATERDSLIAAALARTAPGFGGDGPESAIAEGLYQVATGLGFDGNGNGFTLESGNAGDVTTQINPGTSGDVPAFSSNTAPTSGTIGGVGWRGDSLRLVILATDIASIAAFPAGEPIPATITGAGGSSEPVSAFAASSTTPGSNRFGYVSDSKTQAGNTIPGAVVPAEAGTVQETVNALNALGIQVLGMGPGAAPTTSPGPSSNESVFLSAIARLTGALDADGDPLVFSTSVSPGDLANAIADAIATAATAPVDITLGTTVLPAGLSFSAAPSVVSDVPPGGTASFVVTLQGDGSPIVGAFDILFIEADSGAILGSAPVTVDCSVPPVCTTILDNFNRHDTRLGGNWSGSTSEGNYRLVNDAEIEVQSGGAAYWKEPAFGAEQEACVTLTKIDNNGHQTVLLKVQPNNSGAPNWKKGVIAVFYNTEGSDDVGVETYVPGQGWTTLLSIPMTLNAGDQLAGSALADGTVEVLVNGVVVGAADAGSFFADKGGHIGVWFIGSKHGRFDDFAGR